MLLNFLYVPCTFFRITTTTIAFIYGTKLDRLALTSDSLIMITFC